VWVVHFDEILMVLDEAEDLTWDMTWIKLMNHFEAMKEKTDNPEICSNVFDKTIKTKKKSWWK